MEDANTLLKVVSGVIIPFAVIWLQKVTWSSQAKFALAALLSLIAGGLTAYIAGDLLLTGSVVQNAFTIFGTAQLVYFGAFRGLGLEKVLFPQEALVNQAKEQIAVETANVTVEDARDILDPNTPPKLEVTSNVVNTTGSVS